MTGLAWRAFLAAMVGGMLARGTTVRAAVLGQQPLPPNSVVGMMASTFDPLTLDHERLIQAVLDSGKVDVLVLVPNDLTPHKPRRTTIEARHAILMARYGSTPRVLVPKAYRYGIPQGRGIAKMLRAAVSGISIVGVLLASDIKKPGLKEQIFRFFTPADRWLLLKAPGAPASLLDAQLAGLSVSLLEVPEPGSSGAVRKSLRTLWQSNDMTTSEAINALPLSPEVAAYIRTNGLYRTSPSICPLLVDIYRTAVGH